MKRRATAVLLAVLASCAASCTPERPSIAFVDGVPEDVRSLARSTWERFLAAFPAQTGCLVPVAVDVARQLDHRATYEPSRRLVTVRVPGTAPNLAATLLHEFAHHLEFTCDRMSRLRPVFLAAQGLPVRTPWSGGATWETTPSEQFAEAVAELVLGRAPAHHRVVISDRSLEAIRAWARGG